MDIVKQKIELKQCKVSELTADERRKCARLSFGRDGDLRFWLGEYPDGAVVTAWDGPLLLGWGMRTPVGYTGYYVRANMRRKGIGTEIYYTLNPPRKKVVVFPHDTSSAAFFYSLRKISKDDLVYHSGATPKELGIKRKSRRFHRKKD